MLVGGPSVAWTGPEFIDTGQVNSALHSSITAIESPHSISQNPIRQNTLVSYNGTHVFN